MKKLASSLSSFSPYNTYSRAIMLLTTIQPLSIDPLLSSFSLHQNIITAIINLSLPP